ncbi:MAG: hypothetical protein E6772_16760 [Dysgonomonas sp.]|nr:hypothetical protein [Dysgonomonas sp.]
MNKRILIACEFSGTVRDAFSRAGWDAWSCDIIPTESLQTLEEGKHIQADVLTIINEDWDVVIAHPPCTFLTRRAQYWNKIYNRESELENAINFFTAIAEAPCKHLAIENPIGIMSKLYKKPSQIIQPYEFGDPESKATCLWLKNLPNLTPTKRVEPIYHISATGRKYAFNDKIWDKKLRQKLRSKTFSGIADAMAEQWTEYLM